MVGIVVAVILVSTIVIECVVKPRMKIVNVTSWFLMQLGGPLIAETSQNTDDNKEDDDDENKDRESISYLIGIVSFGPRVWFVPFDIYISNFFAQYNFNFTFNSFLFFSGTPGFPGDEIFISIELTQAKT